MTSALLTYGIVGFIFSIQFMLQETMDDRETDIFMDIFFFLGFVILWPLPVASTLVMRKKKDADNK